MTLLEEYRLRSSQVTPAAFSAHISGASILYLYDPDPSAKRPYSMRSFQPDRDALLSGDLYTPFWSLNCFHNGERKERCFASTLAVGVDIDCATTAEFTMLNAEEMDSRKDSVLIKLQALDINPHMVNETPKGLHIVFFIERRTGEEGLALFKGIMSYLVPYFGGDDAAALVTQVLRFPNSLHRKNLLHPFVCTCLINQLSLPPHNPEDLLRFLRGRCPAPVARQRAATRPRTDAMVRGIFRKFSASATQLSPTRLRIPARKWQTIMGGVGEGQRNDAAASVAGMLLRKYPASEWQMRVWTELQAWNERNRPPLDERELRNVFESIQRSMKAERERTPQKQHVHVRCSVESKNTTVSITFPAQS